MKKGLDWDWIELTDKQTWPIHSIDELETWAKVKAIVATPTTGIVESNPWAITVPIQAWELDLVLPQDVASIIQRYWEFIELGEIIKLFESYDWTTLSIESIIDKVTQAKLERLAWTEVDFSLFWKDVTKLVKKIELAIIWWDRAVANFVAYRTSKWLTNAFYRVIWFLWKLPDVVWTVISSRNFVVKSNEEIQQHIKSLDILKDKSEIEIKDLLGNYILYKMLIVLITKQLGKLNTNDSLTEAQKLEKRLLEERLISLTTIAESIPSVIAMNHWAKENTELVKINLKTQFDRLVNQLSILINTINVIYTVTESQELSRLFWLLWNMTLQVTFKLFESHLNSLEKWVKAEIDWLNYARLLDGEIKITIETSGKKLDDLRSQLLKLVEEEWGIKNATLEWDNNKPKKVK